MPSIKLSDALKVALKDASAAPEAIQGVADRVPLYMGDTPPALTSDLVLGY
jgi:hypothetical protein